MSDGRRIVPEVVKTEMCYISPFEHPLEHDGDGVGIEGGNMSKFADSVRHKCGGADISVGTACLGSFQVPFFVRAEDNMDFQFRAPYGIDQCLYPVIRGDIKLRTYFSAAWRFLGLNLSRLRML